MISFVGEINTIPAPTPSPDEAPSNYNFHRIFWFSIDRGVEVGFVKGKDYWTTLSIWNIEDPKSTSNA